MSEHLEDAWKEFERTGEVANSAEGLLVHASLLTEENAKLREFVKKVSELDIETFCFETKGGDEDYIEYVCTDIVDDAVDLLAKLNQEGEE